MQNSGGGTLGSAEGKEVRQLDRSPEVRKAGGQAIYVIADSAADPQSQDSEMQKHGGQSDVEDDTNPLPQSLPRGRDVKRSSSRFTLHSSLNKKVAFTLAEVLITLGIIGVVAAITIPAIVANYQKHVTVVQLKKAYTVFSQALERSVQDNGEVEYWDWQNLDTANQNFGEKYILPYLKGVSKADNAVRWKSLDGSFNDNWGSGIFTGGYMYSTSDGMLFKFSGLPSLNDPVNIRKTHLRIVIDINGRRGPNRYGRDVFMFSIFPFYEDFKGKLVPGTNDQCGNGLIHNTQSRDYLLSQGCWTCKSDHSGTGYACAALIMKDGWQIKDDYPW